MKKRVIILGATGSIGRSALDVVAANPGRFELVGLSTHSNTKALEAVLSKYQSAVGAFTGPGLAPAGIAFSGSGAALELLDAVEADIVVNGISGAAGLSPSFKAVSMGRDLALANKETVVMAGPLVMAAAALKNARLLPVDSEHSAIFQLLAAQGAEKVEELVLTASGGPFRAWPVEKLARVDAAQALAHPTWKMGGKITIDSATLANKGLEVIEAVRLFGFPPEKVRVLVHPQSLVHSLVRLLDGSLYAQISEPDMRLPIHNALFWPDCLPSPFGRLELAGRTMSFEEPDRQAFPMLDLAYSAIRSGAAYPIAYNAADEVAVAEFRAGRIGFMAIAELTRRVLAADWSAEPVSIGAVLEADGAARRIATDVAKELAA
jgi:1-deoxy-D-xylulose-5-phosphate reductoisomerase